MRAVFLSNLVSRAFTKGFIAYQYDTDRLNSSTQLLPAGTYTVSATVPEGVTCFVKMTNSGGGSETFLPASGEYTLPFTFELAGVRWVTFYFGYAGFRGEPRGTWTDIDDSDVQDISVTRSGSPSHDIYETVMIRPDEIPDSDTISKAVCAKSTVTLTVFPHFEAWGFARRGETFVRVMDTEDGMIFRGRVSLINDRMTAGGVQSQVLTCLSSADYMEETGYTDDIPAQGLDAWLGYLFAHHNANIELARRLTFTLTGAAKVSSNTDYIAESNYKILSEVLSGGKYLSEGTGAFKPGYRMEWRERYHNDVTYIDIAEKLGTDCDTAILIGDNLKEINIERGLDGGIYSSVMAVSGVCSDGYRMACTAYNDDMYTRYGGGRQAVVVNDDIYFSGKGGRDPLPGGGYNWYRTPEVQAAEERLKAFAEAEAAKLSDLPIKITLSAADLAKMGYTGYEPFEVYNTYPVVYPPGGLFGQRMRLTAITRRLSDGQITNMTVECGEKLSDAGSSLTAQITRISASSGGDDTKMIDILEETTGGLSFDPLTQAEFDAITNKDDNTIYYVDDDGDISIYKGDTHISTGGGGGDEPTIETAAVLTSEQMATWAPDHELAPVEFRGSAMVYYAQAPSRIVVQGQRALFGVEESAVTADDIMSEITFDFIDGERCKVKTYFTEMSTSSVIVQAALYDVSGAAETMISVTSRYTYNLPSGWTSLRIGIAVYVANYFLNESEQLAATLFGRLQVFADNTKLGYGEVIPIKGSGSQTVNFGSDAERGFASGISRRTEPSFPNSEVSGE